MRKNHKIIAAMCAMVFSVASLGTFSASALTDEGAQILLTNMRWFANKIYTVETDTFQYREDGKMTLKTDVLDYDNGSYYMVSGLLYGHEEYAGKVVNVCLTSIHSPESIGHGLRVILYNTPEGFDLATVQTGDIYRLVGEGCVLEGAPGELSIEKMELVGNGLELFGEDFQKVIDYEYLTDEEILHKEIPAANEPKRGDVTGDDSVDIMDVITINQYLLGSCTLNADSKAAADVDGSGEIDSTDSLMILKEVVEVTKDFVEK